MVEFNIILMGNASVQRLSAAFRSRTRTPPRWSSRDAHAPGYLHRPSARGGQPLCSKKGRRLFALALDLSRRSAMRGMLAITPGGSKTARSQRSGWTTSPPASRSRPPPVGFAVHLSAGRRRRATDHAGDRDGRRRLGETPSRAVMALAVGRQHSRLSLRRETSSGGSQRMTPDVRRSSTWSAA